MDWNTHHFNDLLQRKAVLVYRLSLGKNYEVSGLASNTGGPEGRKCLFINNKRYICLES